MSDAGRRQRAVPSLRRLEEDGVEAIHEASMHIVEELGIRVGHDRARRIFAAHGATVEDEVVTVPRDIVENAVSAAPAAFTLRARNPDNDVTVGGDGPPVRAPGHGPPHVRTIGAGRRRARLSDYDDLAKLAQVEDVITCTGSRLCQPVDLDDSSGHTELFRRALTLTDQPVIGPTHGAARARASLDMAGIAMDDPDLSEPYVAGLVNTVPPRSIGEGMLAGLLTYAEHGQPPIVSSFTMAGASGPAPLAASMAQANAENLVGITLAQLVNPGTPVIYGVPSSNIDSRHGSLSIGSPESALFVWFAAAMGRYYDLPSRGGGGLSDAKTIDYQSGFESMLLQTVTAFSGIDFVLHAAGVLESYSTISPEKFVLDCEAIRYLDRFGTGFSVDEGSFALDDIASTEPAGHFAGSPTRGEFFRSAFVDKRSHAAWEDAGGKSAGEMAADRVRARLEGYDRPALAEDKRRDLKRYVAEQRG